MSIFNVPSPIEEVLNHPFNFRLFVKREDKIHPQISGNKYRKLKYNLQFFFDQQCNGLISFGGAYSNHIYALASIGKTYNIQTVGIIRGHENMENECLRFATSCGMKLHFVDRNHYAEKENNKYIADIISSYPHFMLLPEGGSNELALIGVKEMSYEIVNHHIKFDYILVSAGTGCTASGILSGLKEHDCTSKLMVFSALKGNFLKYQIMKWSQSSMNDFIFTDEFCLGGYARVSEPYLKFIRQFENNTGIAVDDIYNGKLVYALNFLNERKYFDSTAKLLWIHTGGLQGRTNYEN